LRERVAFRKDRQNEIAWQGNAYIILQALLLLGALYTPYSQFVTMKLESGARRTSCCVH